MQFWRRLLQISKQQSILSLRHYSSENWDVISNTEVKRFARDCMTSVGTRPQHADSLAEVLVQADYRGHYSHGLNRLDMYVKDIESGVTVSDKEPVILKESPATAFVDGQNVLGPVVGDFCMDLAINKAKRSGVGWVVAKGSNHYGIAGHYAIRASEAGLLGMSFTNTSPLVVPTRAKKPILGTNPISLAAPGLLGDSFVLDMATSTAALGKIEIHERKQIPIPNSWGVDAHGKMTNNPTDVLNGGGQMPLGGAEETSGYKGSGLGFLVEIFCGILSGSAYGPNIRRWKNTTTVANLGQCFIAVDPDSFMPGFEERMSDLMGICRNQEPVEKDKEVLVAGDPERIHMKMCDERGGIPYHPNQIQYAIDLSNKLNVVSMEIVRTRK